MMSVISRNDKTQKTRADKKLPLSCSKVKTPTINHHQSWWLVLSLLLAFFLRVNGLGFGLPYVLHDDEHQYVDAGVAFLQGPEQVLSELQKLNNPPLFKTVLGALYLLYSYSLTPGPGSFSEIVYNENWRIFFQYAGRFASVSTSILTIPLLYALGRRLYNRSVGVLASLLLAAVFLPTREAHFAVNDSPLTMLAVASVYTAAGILKRGAWFDYLATGILIGLAGAVKYTAVYLVIVIPTAHILRIRYISSPKNLSTLRFLLGLILIPITFTLSAPTVILSGSELVHRLQQLSEYGQTGYHSLLLDPMGGWIFYLKALVWGIGLLLTLALIPSLIAGLRHRSPADILLISFPLLLYGIMSMQKMFFVRFILPAVPPLLVLIAGWLFRNAWFRRRPGLITAILLVQPFLMSIWLGVLLNRPDTRIQALNWITTHLPSGQVIYAEDKAIPEYAVTGPLTIPFITLNEIPFDYPTPLEHLRNWNATYLITSSYHHQRQFSNPAIEAGRRTWLATLDKMEPIQQFNPYWLAGNWFTFDQRLGPWSETLLRTYPGPQIEIYELDTQPGYIELNPFDAQNQIKGKLGLFGYQILPVPPIQPTETVTITLFWQEQNYWLEADELRLAIVDNAGYKITQTTATLVPEPSTALPVSRLLHQSQALLTIPNGTPPGFYRLQIEVYNNQRLETAGILDLGAKAITVAPSVLPASPPENALLLIPELLVAPVQDTGPLSLLLGKDNWLVLQWWTTQDITTNYLIQLDLLDSQHTVKATWQSQPVHNTYPTSQWSQGQLIRDPWKLTLPDSLEPNSNYQLQITIFEEQGQPVARKIMGPISVKWPQAKLPVMQYTTSAMWDNAIKLLGFNIRAIPETQNRGWLEIDLYWQALQPVSTDYEIRIDLQTPEGYPIISQQTGPAGGKAPTSSWISGELVHDFHAIHYQQLAMDQKYQLKVSLFDPTINDSIPVATNGTIHPSLTLIEWP